LRIDQPPDEDPAVPPELVPDVPVELPLVSPLLAAPGCVVSSTGGVLGVAVAVPVVSFVPPDMSPLWSVVAPGIV
jgi:hypothetical protein